MLAKGDEEETNDEESTPMAESPKQVKSKVGTKELVMDACLKEPVDPVVSQEDITED